MKLKLTAEKRTRHSPWQWAAGLGWVASLACVIFLNPPAADWWHLVAIFTGWAFLALALWLSRKRCVCRTCGGQVRWGETFLTHDQVEPTIAKFGLKKPLFLKNRLQLGLDWRITVITCDRCAYSEVVRMEPTNWDG